MKITEVQLHFIKPRDGIVAFANVVIEHKLFVGSIAVHAKLDGSGFRLTFPTKGTNGKNFHIFHPIDKAFGAALEKAVIDKLKDVMSKGKSHVGHGCTLT